MLQTCDPRLFLGARAHGLEPRLGLPALRPEVRFQSARPVQDSRSAKVCPVFVDLLACILIRALVGRAVDVDRRSAAGITRATRTNPTPRSSAPIRAEVSAEAVGGRCVLSHSHLHISLTLSVFGSAHFCVNTITLFNLSA